MQKYSFNNDNIAKAIEIVLQIHEMLYALKFFLFD